jgi:hypothetical protein
MGASVRKSDPDKAVSEMEKVKQLRRDVLNYGRATGHNETAKSVMDYEPGLLRDLREHYRRGG